MRLDLASSQSLTEPTQSTGSFPQGNGREDCRVVTAAHYFYIDHTFWEGDRDLDSLPMTMEKLTVQSAVV